MGAGDEPAFTNQWLNVAAIVEPDADADGFRDGQGQCPGVGGPNNGCPEPSSEPTPTVGDGTPPGATVTKGPKNKTKKASATFEFTGTDPTRAVAGFQCSLDGAAFAPCTSPHTVRVKKGKHTFSVRAIDDSGNVGSPASDDWEAA